MSCILYFQKYQKCVYSVTVALVVMVWCLSRLTGNVEPWYETDMTETESVILNVENVVPKILHQTWKSYRVPVKYAAYIKSWLKHNPDWEYWFWTDADIETFLNVKFENLKPMFANFSQGIRKADAMRYMVMYEVGGTYADLDMECLKPFTLLSSYDCYVSEENYEHTTLLYHRLQPIMINCVMGCRAKHPFYRDVVEALSKQPYRLNVVEHTGPLFFTSVFEQYQVRRNVTLSDHVVVLPPRYLLPERDPYGNFMKHACDKNLKTYTRYISQPDAKYIYFHNPSVNLPQEQREAELCFKLQISNFAQESHPEALAVHHWVHTYLFSTRVRQIFESTIDIRVLVPNLKSYARIVAGKQISKFYNA